MKTDYAAQMQRFGACNGGPGTEAIDQPGKYIDVRFVDGKPNVIVDCWSWLVDEGFVENPGEFLDVDMWYACELRMLPSKTHESVRAFWYESFSVARSLVNGKEIKLPGLKPFTIHSWTKARLDAFAEQQESR